jgi:uncharacterized protein YjbJ (UPF0337 family)
MATGNRFAEESSALGERAEGAVKDAAGEVTDNRSLESEGERENRAGREPKAATNVSDETILPGDAWEIGGEGWDAPAVFLRWNRDWFGIGQQGDGESKRWRRDWRKGGAILATVAAIGTSIAIPGPGVVVAGPIATAFAGAGVGGPAGGIIGALIGWGVPEERAKLYESDLKDGGIVLGVSPRSDDDAVYFEGEWKGYNGRNIYCLVAAATSIC